MKKSGMFVGTFELNPQGDMGFQHGNRFKKSNSDRKQFTAEKGTLPHDLLHLPSARLSGCKNISPRAREVYNSVVFLFVVFFLLVPSVLDTDPFNADKCSRTHAHLGGGIMFACHSW